LKNLAGHILSFFWLVLIDLEVHNCLYACIRDDNFFFLICAFSVSNLVAIDMAKAVTLDKVLVRIHAVCVLELAT
jgi:hypothetical protein